ncbi:hypothetical protein E4U42_003707 [Claviceps africana]|uniref:Ubiquitin-like domain-containing protein n=1 Tax=Claviceps africana TaxID=83212 RepID=A0A8K0NGM9_9HYPO|nr:hypothetical protein E4U42_003707 [Claviceps africana]
MAEAAFAKTFLSSLDSRPFKLSADHVEDPKSFPARPPYILPRMPTPMSRPKTVLPGQERSITVVLKSLRNPPLDVKLTSQPLTTSVLDIKARVAEQTRIPVDKLKVLHNKRPLTDSKILKDVLGDDAVNRVELSVMVIGGAATIVPEQNAAVPAAASGRDALTTDVFWEDLHGFLLQRLKDEETAGQMAELFKASWESSRAAS